MLITLHQVTCECGAHSKIYDGAIYSPAEIRAQIREEGWRRIRHRFGMADQCPTCAAHATRKKAA